MDVETHATPSPNAPVYETPLDLPEAMSYEQTLAYSQGLRKLVANGLVKNGVPADKEGVEMLLKTLKDMDGTALGERKNKIEAGAATSSKEVNEALVEIIKQQANQNPFKRKADGSVARDDDPAAIPAVDVARLGEFEVVQGETEIGIIGENSAEFFARMGHKLSNEE